MKTFDITLNQAQANLLIHSIDLCLNNLKFFKLDDAENGTTNEIENLKIIKSKIESEIYKQRLNKKFRIPEAGDVYKDRDGQLHYIESVNKEKNLIKGFLSWDLNGTFTVGEISSVDLVEFVEHRDPSEFYK